VNLSFIIELSLYKISFFLYFIVSLQLIIPEIEPKRAIAEPEVQDTNEQEFFK